MKTFAKLLGITTILAATNAQAHEEAHKHLRMPEGHQQKTGVIVGGIIDFQSAYREEDQQHSTYSRNTVFKNDTEVHVHVNQIADNGARYGAVVELEADVTAADKDEGLNADKTYLYLESNLGRLELGSNSDAGHTLGVDASTFARATGGVHGDIEDYIHIPHGHGAGPHHPFIHSPGLPLAHDHGASEDATKITYYTPRNSGFQFGASYIPDSGNVGTAAGFTTDADSDNYENVVNLGVQHSGRLGEIDTLASITGEFGNAESAVTEDLAAVAAGLNLSYAGFTVGGNYSYWGDSMKPVASTADDAHSWSVGAGYETGPFGVSIGYLNGEFMENNSEIVSVGADYQLAPGLVPYVEVNFFDFEWANPATTGNNGTYAIVGTTLSF